MAPKAQTARRQSGQVSRIYVTTDRVVSHHSPLRTLPLPLPLLQVGDVSSPHLGAKKLSLLMRYIPEAAGWETTESRLLSTRVIEEHQKRETEREEESLLYAIRATTR